MRGRAFPRCGEGASLGEGKRISYVELTLKHLPRPLDAFRQRVNLRFRIV